MKQLSNNNKRVTLKTSSYNYTASIDEVTNEIYIVSNIDEKLTWELTEVNIDLVNSAMQELSDKNGVTNREYMFIEEEYNHLYDTLEDNYTMNEILKAL